MTEKQPPLTYAGAGIDLDARQRVVARYRGVSRLAGRPEVLGGVGPFAGLFALGSVAARGECRRSSG